MLLKLLIFWRISLLLITYIGSVAFPLVPNKGVGAIDSFNDFDYWSSWAQWDGGHYLAIAEHGYKSAEDFAFFPIYPYLISLLEKLLGNYLLAGLLISNVLFFIFIFIFYSIVAKYYSDAIAKSATVSLLFFPTAFFATAFYSESLFMLLSVATFYYLWGKRYLLASIAVNLASITRTFGILLGISMIYSYMANNNFSLKRVDKKLIAVLSGFFTFALYLLLLKFHQGDPLRFMNVQSLWQRSFTDPISTVASYIVSIIRLENRPIIDYLDLGLTLFFTLVLITGRRKIPSSLWIFSFLVILLPAATGTLTSMPRYMLSALGAFIIIGDFLERNPNYKMGYWAISLLLQIFLAVRFINGYWAS